MPAFEVGAFAGADFFLPEPELAVLLVDLALVATVFFSAFAGADFFLPEQELAVLLVDLALVATVFFGDAETSQFLSTTTTWKEFVPPGLSETFIDAAADAGTLLTRIPLR